MRTFQFTIPMGKRLIRSINVPHDPLNKCLHSKSITAVMLETKINKEKKIHIVDMSGIQREK